MNLKEQLANDIKDAMRARAQEKLGALRLIMSAIKQVEIDERIDVDDARVLAIFDKLSKQRQESIAQFSSANRFDLVEKEQFELAILQHYLPEPLSEESIRQHIDAALAETGAQRMSDMSKIMACLKPALQGRADMAKVSAMVKARLSA